MINALLLITLATTSASPPAPPDDLCASLPTRDVAIEIKFNGVPSALSRARADAYEKCGAPAAATTAPARVAKIFIFGPNGGGGGLTGSYNVVDAGRLRNGRRAYGNEPPNTQANLDDVVDVTVRNALQLAITPDAPELPAEAAVCKVMKGVKVALASTGTTSPAAAAEFAARLEERCATVVHLASPDDAANKKRADYVVVLDVRSERAKYLADMERANKAPMYRVDFIAHIVAPGAAAAAAAAGERPVGNVFEDDVVLGMTVETAIVAKDRQWKSDGGRGKAPIPFRSADDVVAWIVKDRAVPTSPTPPTR